MISLSVRGEKKIMRQLKKLPVKIRRKVLRKASREAMKPVLKAARNNAPKQSGALKKAIKLRALKRNRRGLVGVKVAVGKDWFQGDQFYGAFQEFGYKGIEGKHFVENAYDTHGEGAKRRFMDLVPKQIEKAMKG